MAPPLSKTDCDYEDENEDDGEAANGSPGFEARLGGLTLGLAWLE